MNASIRRPVCRTTREHCEEISSKSEGAVSLFGHRQRPRPHLLAVFSLAWLVLCIYSIPRYACAFEVPHGPLAAAVVLATLS